MFPVNTPAEDPTEDIVSEETIEEVIEEEEKKINEEIIISIEDTKKELNLRKKNASTKTNSN